MKNLKNVLKEVSNMLTARRNQYLHEVLEAETQSKGFHYLCGKEDGMEEAIEILNGIWSIYNKEVKKNG